MSAGGMPCQPGSLIIQPEQLDDVRDVLVAADRRAHPAGLRMMMVQHRFVLGHELLADADRERHVRERAAVQVAELAAADAELDEAAAPHRYRDVGPGANFTRDAISDCQKGSRRNWAAPRRA